MAHADFVPFYAPIRTRYLFSKEEKLNRFPFTAKHKCYYYLGRNGIWNSLPLLGLREGDEVLMPAYNNGVEVETYLRRGIRPVYFRVSDSMKVDWDDARRRVTPRTKILHLIHYNGIPQDLSAARALCQDQGLLLFEDCALALLSEWCGVPLGSVGEAAIFCLAKFLPVPHGAVLVLNREGLPEPPETRTPDAYSTWNPVALKWLEAFHLDYGGAAGVLKKAIQKTAQSIIRAGRLKRVPPLTLDFYPESLNWGMHPVSFRILASLDLEAIRQRRIENHRYLDGRIRELGISAMRPANPAVPEGAVPLFYGLRVPDSEELCLRMQERGIGAGAFWRWSHPAVPVEPYPDVTALRREVLELQIHQGLDREHLDLQVKVLLEVWSSLARRRS